MSSIATIVDVACSLPTKVLTNEQLSCEVEGLDPAKMLDKLGIRERRIVAGSECASDLAVAAAEKLFSRCPSAREKVDYILFCTQSPDYILPTTACLLQSRLGLTTNCGALDFNLGCSGYVYGLSLAKGLIESEQAQCVLLLTGDTYSKFLLPTDRSCRALFGDAASATLICRASGEMGPGLGPFIFGTDGSGAEQLIIRAGGCRQPQSESARDRCLQMDGPAIFAFTLKRVPEALHRLLAVAGVEPAAVDWYVFHQANQYMLSHLISQMRLPADRCPIFMEHCGNTVSTSIPLVLEALIETGRLQTGMTVALIGFGVGLSWAAALVQWQGQRC